MALSGGEYASGFVFLLLVLGATAASAAILTRRRLSHLTGLSRALAAATLFVGLLFAVHLAPAMAGVLSRGSVGLCSLAVLGLSAAVPSSGAAPDSGWPGPVAGDSRLSRWLAALACAIVATFLLGVALAIGGVPPTNVDTLTWHLPSAAGWIQSASIWQIDQFVADQAQAYYPNTGNVMQLSAVLPWRSDFAIRLVALPFIALAGAGVFAAARELGAPGSAAALAAAVSMSVPAVTVYAVEKPSPDAVMLAGFAVGGYFLLLNDRAPNTGNLVLAGIALGLSFGAKWYGVSSVIALVAVWVVARLVARHPPASVGRDFALVGGLVTLVGGVWLLRNGIESGNPMFPLEVSLAGVEVLNAPADPIGDQFGFSIADYAGQPSVLADHGLTAWRDYLGLPALVAALGILALPLIRRSIGAGSERDHRVPAVAAAALVLTLTYVVTPYSALGPDGDPAGIGVNARYAVPGLMAACCVLAVVVGRSGRFRHALEAVLVLAVIDGVMLGTPLAVRQVAVAMLAAGLLAGVAFLVWRFRTSAGTVSALAASTAAAIACFAAGWFLQERFNDDRYAIEDTALAPLARDDVSGRVGIAGFWDLSRLPPVLPAFGPRLENEVSYIGEFEDGMLRPAESAGDFARIIEQQGVELLLVGKEPLATRSDQPEDEWARQAGFKTLAESDRFTLFETLETAAER